MQNVAGVALFLFWRNELLLVLRDDKPDISCPNVWCVPTGGLDGPEETYQEGADRECLEELSISPKLRLWEISSKDNGIFFAELSDEEKDAIDLGEGQTFGFFSALEVDALNQAGFLGGITKVYYEADHEVLSVMKSPWDKVPA